MIKYSLSVLALLSSTIAIAAPVTSSGTLGPKISTEEIKITDVVVTDVKNIDQGNFEVGGGFRFEKDETSQRFSISPRLSYFVANRFSAGAFLDWQMDSFDGQGDFASLAIGPAVRYYFWEQDRLATYVGQDLGWKSNQGRTNSGRATNEDFYGRSILGFNYFITSEIAVGMSANYLYSLDNSKFSSSSFLEGAFSLFF